MDLKNILDIIESFGVGFIIFLSIVMIGFMAYFLLSFIEMIDVHSTLTFIFNFLLIVCILIALGTLMYYVGKIVKKPLKNNVNNNLNSFANKPAFCQECGFQLKSNARFCDNCGAKVKR